MVSDTLGLSLPIPQSADQRKERHSRFLSRRMTRLLVDWLAKRFGSASCRRLSTRRGRCRSHSNAVLGLGPLARWLLRREVFVRAAEDSLLAAPIREGWREWSDHPHVAGTYGSCWVIFVTEHPAELPLARDAFVLPLRWVRDTEHSELLPPELHEQAEMTFKSMRDLLQHPATRWGLHLANELSRVDLRGLHVRAESGWAPLAAGLYIASEGGTPDPTVWATGSWSFSEGLCAVDEIAIKSQLAAEFGATTFFVPDGQQADVAAGLPATPGLTMGTLHTGTLAPSRALEDLLLGLDATPPAPTSATDTEGIDRCKNLSRSSSAAMT